MNLCDKTCVMRVKIYKPSKNTMQSGRAALAGWLLENDEPIDGAPENLMGWSGASSTYGQVKLKFESLDDAKAFAERKGWDYTVLPEKNRQLKPRNYSDNFKYIPPKAQEKA